MIVQAVHFLFRAVFNAVGKMQGFPERAFLAFPSLVFVVSISLFPEKKHGWKHGDLIRARRAVFLFLACFLSACFLFSPPQKERNTTTCVPEQVLKLNGNGKKGNQ